jgi:hypothetical protein
LGRGWRKDNPRDSESSVSARTAARALVAVGAYVAQDLRDRDGVTRPLLRRAALRLVTSRHAVMHRLGDAYLHGDPPTPEELAAGRQAAQPLLLAPGQPGQEPGAPRSPATPDNRVAAV